jgi:hypothetical protein
MQICTTRVSFLRTFLLNETKGLWTLVEISRSARDFQAAVARSVRPSLRKASTASVWALANASHSKAAAMSSLE